MEELGCSIRDDIIGVIDHESMKDKIKNIIKHAATGDPIPSDSNIFVRELC
jgi:hypothetical protein